MRRIKVGALPDQAVLGRLSRIAPQAQKSEGATLFDVEIELEEGQEVVLRAGYSANSDVVIREKTCVLTISERLVSFEGDGAAASVEAPGLTPDAEPRKVAVELGLLGERGFSQMSQVRWGSSALPKRTRTRTRCGGVESFLAVAPLELRSTWCGSVPRRRVVVHVGNGYGYGKPRLDRPGRAPLESPRRQRCIKPLLPASRPGCGGQLARGGPARCTP